MPESKLKAYSVLNSAICRIALKAGNKPDVIFPEREIEDYLTLASAFNEAAFYMPKKLENTVRALLDAKRWKRVLELNKEIATIGIRFPLRNEVDMLGLKSLVKEFAECRALWADGTHEKIREMLKEDAGIYAQRPVVEDNENV